MREISKWEKYGGNNKLVMSAPTHRVEVADLFTYDITFAESLLLWRRRSLLCLKHPGPSLELNIPVQCFDWFWVAADSQSDLDELPQELASCLSIF